MPSPKLARHMMPASALLAFVATVLPAGRSGLPHLVLGLALLSLYWLVEWAGIEGTYEGRVPSTSDRMSLRLPGTLNDVAVTRARDYPLERIGVPVLVVHGTHDRAVPFARHGRILAERIPGAELVALVGGDHVAIFTHRDEARARVVPFLARHAT